MHGCLDFWIHIAMGHLLAYRNFLYSIVDFPRLVAHGGRLLKRIKDVQRIKKTLATKWLVSLCGLRGHDWNCCVWLLVLRNPLNRCITCNQNFLFIEDVRLQTIQLLQCFVFVNFNHISSQCSRGIGRKHQNGLCFVNLQSEHTTWISKFFSNLNVCAAAQKWSWFFVIQNFIGVFYFDASIQDNVKSSWSICNDSLQIIDKLFNKSFKQVTCQYERFWYAFRWFFQNTDKFFEIKVGLDGLGFQWKQNCRSVVWQILLL